MMLLGFQFFPLRAKTVDFVEHLLEKGLGPFKSLAVEAWRISRRCLPTWVRTAMSTPGSLDHSACSFVGRRMDHPRVKGVLQTMVISAKSPA
jgi:hypothetical protein